MAVLTPAYGRKYHTFEEVDRAYRTGKDFVYHNPASQWNGKYCSCRDFLGEPVELRFGENLEHVSVIQVNENEE